MTDMQTFFRKSHRTQSASDHSATPLAVEHVAFLKPEHALLHVKSSRQGLTTEEAGKRLK